MLEVIQQTIAVPAAGSSPVDTEALAAQATDRTQKLLAEAVELQRQNKERDAIERLLTAYDMDMAAKAKAELHALAGNGFFRLSELEQTEGHHRQALAAAEEADDREAQASAFGNLGNVYRNRGNLDKAEDHYNRAGRIYAELGNERGQANVVGSLGLVYARRGDAVKAEDHLEAGPRDPSGHRQPRG